MNPGRHRFFLLGMGRSGTSWAAGMLAAATDGHLLYEPYNWNLNPEGSVYRLRYVKDVPPDWRFDEVLRERFRWLPRDGRPAVIKDVMTSLAAPYLHRRFGGSMLFIARHPCAVASSWHGLGWDAGERIDLLLAQRDLISDHLAPYVGHLREDSNPWKRLGALWGAIHFVIRRQFRTDLGWQWLTYEWLCEAPVANTLRVIERTGHKINTSGHEALARFVTEHDRELTATETPFQTFRPTFSHANRWRERLTAEQQSHVMRGIEPFGLAGSWDAPPQNA